MKFPSRALAVLCLIGIGAQQANGQTLLDRLEGRLNQILGPADPLNPGLNRAPVANQPLANPAGTGYLGLRVEQSNDQNSIVVRAIVVNSPADRAGFKLGDEITSMNAKQVRTMDDVASVLERLPPGARLDCEIRRDGRPQVIQTVLAQRGDAATAPTMADRRSPALPGYVPPAPLPGIQQPSTGPTPAAAFDRPTLGITVSPLSEEARVRQGVPVRQGALITGIRPGGAADRFGLPMGGVIVAYDGRRIDSPDDLIDAVLAAKVGDEVELSYYDREKLTRKRVRISPNVDVVNPQVSSDGPNLDPPLVIKSGNPGALNRLEGILDGLTGGGNNNNAAVKAAPSDEVVQLRKQVEMMQRQIDDLQRKIKESESKGTLPPPAIEKE